METMGQKRKRYAEEFKAKVAVEAIKGICSLRERSSSSDIRKIDVIGAFKTKTD